MLPIKRKPLLMGTDRTSGQAVSLKHDWLETHVQMVGPPGTGKTRLMLSIFKALAREPEATVILMNPKGSLFRMARDWAIADGLTERLVLFDPGEENAIIGYNPLAANGLAAATHAKAVREALRSAWGQASFDQTPQLARLLFLVLAVARVLELTLIDSVQLIRPRSATRRRALRDLSAGPLRDALAYFDSMTDKRQEELAASTLARLEPFIFDETIRRMVVQQNRGLSLDAVIGGNKILLINLEQFRPLRTDDVKLLGRLLMNDVLAHVFARPENHRTPVYLILDEVQTFATFDLCTALDQGRELGLHCLMAHQHPSQLIEEDQSGRLLSSVMNCARTKMLIDEFDPYTVKDEIKHLELEPVESRRFVFGGSLSFGRSSGTSTGKSRSGSHQRGWSHSEGMSHTEGGSITSGSSVSEFSGSGMGVSVSPEGDVIQSTNTTSGGGQTFSESSTQSYASTHSEADSESESVGSQIGEQVSNSTGQSTGQALSMTAVPFYEYKKRRVVSARTFLSEAEFLTLGLQKLRLQPRGHFALKVPGKRAVFLRAPLVKEPWLSVSARDRALARVFSQPYYSSPQQIAQEETEKRDRLWLARLTNGDTIEGHRSNDEVRSTRPRRAAKKLPKPPTD